jgi:hypothetical protein
VTIVNSMRVLALGVLLLLCQACARPAPSAGPPESSAGREAAPAAPSSKPEAQRPVETPTPPRAEPPKPAPETTAPTVATAPKPTPASPAAPASPRPAAPAPPARPAAPPSAAPPPATSAKAPTLDLGSLEKRLRDTKAVGVFTKLSLKNQVDDLLEQFREFHTSRDQSMLTKLRQNYDLLLLKVLSLLQDGDPALARDVSSSREALWSILVDPDKFKNL